MSSRLKKRNDPPDKNSSKEENEETMDYLKANEQSVWQIERELADDIMESLRRNGVDDVFKLDKLTKGAGNCFMVGTMQQLGRDDIYKHCRPEVRELADSINSNLFRLRVNRWVMEHMRHPKIISMREFYEMDQVIRKSEGKETKTWDAYWKYMLKDGHWADNWYVQATALFLGMDYWIFDTTCTKNHPYFTINGSLEESHYSYGALYLGLAHEKHYQSLIENDDDEKDMNDKEEDMIENNDIYPYDATINQDDEIYYSEEDEAGKDDENEDEIYYSEEEDEASRENEKGDEIINDDKDEHNKCPVCKKEFKNLLLHIRKAKKCNSKIDYKEMMELENRSKVIRKDKVRQNVQRHMKRLRKENEERVKEVQNERKAVSRKRLRDENEGKVKEKQNENKAKSMRKLRNENEERVKEVQNERKAVSRKRLRDENE